MPRISWRATLLILQLALSARVGAQEQGAEQASTVEAPAAIMTPAPETTPAGDFKLQPPRVYGYLQAHYRYAVETGSDGVVDNDNFRVQRVRIGVEGKVRSWVGYQLDFDPRAPEIGGILRDAYISILAIPRHELRFGQQKMQFGYENRVSSSKLFAINRTEVSDNLSRGINLRDLGVGLLGNIKLGSGWRLEDAITVGNGARINVQGDDTPTKNVWGRLGVRYRHDASDLTARLGVSGGMGDFIDNNEPLDPLDDERTKFKRLGVDVEVDHRWFFLSSEFVMGRDRNVTLKESDEPSGYYVNLVGKTPWQVGPIARLDTLGEDFRRWTFGAYYGLPDESFRVLINYEYREIFEDATGHIGRGDDKAYLWAQVRF